MLGTDWKPSAMRSELLPTAGKREFTVWVELSKLSIEQNNIIFWRDITTYSPFEITFKTSRMQSKLTWHTNSQEDVTLSQKQGPTSRSLRYLYFQTSTLSSYRMCKAIKENMLVTNEKTNIEKKKSKTNSITRRDNIWNKISIRWISWQTADDRTGQWVHDWSI